MERIRRTKFSGVDYGLILVLGAVALVCLMPIWHTVAVSLSEKSAVSAGKVFLWPIDVNLSSYEKIIGDSQFFVAFWISVKRVALGGLIQFVLTVLMAYPLSQEPHEFRGRNAYMWTLVFTMLFSAGLIPWYMTLKSLGLLNSIWGLVLPGAVPVFHVILLMNFFRNIPKELREAGWVDGAGPWYLMIRIYVPLAVPALATVTLFSIVGHWNSFFDGLLLMSRPEYYPLQTYIQQLVVQVNLDNMSSQDVIQMSKISDKTLNAAKLVVSMIPILIIYPLLQRYFIHGITLGSVKE